MSRTEHSLITSAMRSMARRGFNPYNSHATFERRLVKIMRDRLSRRCATKGSK